MAWTLKAGDEVVGELGPELPQADPNIRSWPLYPTSAFERIRPVIAAQQAMRLDMRPPFPPDITEIQDPSERERAMQQWVRTDPHSLKRHAIFEQVRALKLGVIDAAGTPLQAWAVSVGEFPVLPSMPFEEWMRPDFERAGFRGGPPFYHVVATINPPSWLGPDALREDKLGS